MFGWFVILLGIVSVIRDILRISDEG